MKPTDGSDRHSSPVNELEEIFQRAPVGLCVVDRELRFVRANDAYAQIVRRSVEDLIGRSMQAVTPGAAWAETVAATARVIETGVPALDLDLRCVAPDDPSSESAWWVNIHRLKRDGDVTGAMAVLRDVTSIRRAEDAARERQNELESIYRNAPVGLSYTDRDLRYVRINQQIADMNGVSIQEIIGKTYRDMAPDTADAAEPFFRESMERGDSIRNLEVRVKPPVDPEVEHVYLLNTEPVRNADGELIGQVSAVQDVTELRRTEETAARRLQELEALYANVPIGLCHLDTALRIVHLNPLFAQLSELPLDQQVGASVREILPESTARQVLPHLEHVVHSGASESHVEIRGRTPATGAREFTWSLHVHPVISDAGDVTGIITALQDISVLADQQREIAAVRDRLARAQRVAHLGSWEWNIIGDSVWWSEELYEIFGEHRTYEPSYNGFFDHVHPDERQRVRQQLERTLTGDEPYRMTFRIVRSDGTERVLFTAAQLERTPEGIASKLVGTCQDVTERSARPRVARRSPRG